MPIFNTEESTVTWLAEAQAEWCQALEMLQAGQYEQSAELLQQAQCRNEQLGQIALAEILAATRLLCLACDQCRSEVVWHERAHEVAGERERELKQQLYIILDLIRQSGISAVASDQPAAAPIQPPSAPSLPAPHPGESAAYHSLWQRIQNLLGWASPVPPTEQNGSGPLPAAPSQQQIERVKLPAARLAEFKPEQAFSLVIHCLGPFRVYRNEQLVANWHSLKGQAIFKYLITHQGTPISKDALMEVFWPEADPEAARRNLHQAIYSLRQTLKQGQSDFQAIQFENDCYQLNPELKVWLDCAQFEWHAQAGQRLEAAGQWPAAAVEYNLAEELYRGDFLEEDLYEDWTALPRERRRNMYLDIADRLSEYYFQQGEHAAAITLCQKILAQDNCHEQAHRRLMECYQIQGQRRLAVRQYQLCVQTLKTELDVPPSVETQTLYEKIMGNHRSLVPTF
ncbi:MAG TPA: BTAD domain-containing putative transcriptional regulator [Anaerolineae bacterium]|nr:BTAD domain-containing putative transcriptional regulator [Anaerolineae bacterium]